MHTIEYIFNIQVKGQHISPLEDAANFFLKPAFYFWNGRKVDYIREGKNSVCHWKSIYSLDEEFSDAKYTFFIIAVVPGLIVGSILKCVALCFWHPEGSKALVGRCVDGESNQLFLNSQDRALNNKVLLLIEDLHQLNDSTSNGLLFLSEYSNLKLKYININFSIEHDVDTQQRSQRNQRVLDNLALLCNLQSLETENHYSRNIPTSKEKEILWEMNPCIQAHEREMSEWMEARNYLKNKGWQPSNA